MITKDDERYWKIITIHSESKYDIDHIELKKGESVLCPSDKDLCVCKLENDEIVIRKKSILYPFSK